MWSKSDVKPVPPDTSIDQPENESITEMLMGAIRESNYVKEQPLEDREPKLAEHHSSEPMFVQYAEALDKCTKSAAEFIRYASLLSEARHAYEKLRAASDEIRRALDSDEQEFALSWTWHKKRRRFIWPRPNPF